MKIETLIPWDGPGATIVQIIDRIPDRSTTLADVKEALRWAESDGKVIRYGNYYWRKDRAN
ncbi:MAG: hypothetical protein WCO52_06185 [bacterium]